MKLSGKMWLLIILKVTKKVRFYFVSGRYGLGKTTGGFKLTPPGNRFRFKPNLGLIF